MQIDKNKPVETHEGKRATIYTWTAPGQRPIHGLVEGDEEPTSWRADGSRWSLYESEKDLRNIES